MYSGDRTQNGCIQGKYPIIVLSFLTFNEGSLLFIVIWGYIQQSYGLTPGTTLREHS